MASNDGVEQLPQLSAAPAGSPGSSIDEKAEIRGLQKRHSSDSSLDHKEKLDEKEDPYAHDSEVVYVRGEPVISNGRDVSRFLIDPRDDEDPAISFRSLVIGTVFAGLGAALCQVCNRPYLQTLSTRPLLMPNAPADLSVQTCSDDRIHSLPFAYHLYCWHTVGAIFPAGVMGRMDAFR